jgi:hypothetical protein
MMRDRRANEQVLDLDGGVEAETEPDGRGSNREERDK